MDENRNEIKENVDKTRKLNIKIPQRQFGALLLALVTTNKKTSTNYFYEKLRDLVT